MKDLRVNARLRLAEKSLKRASNQAVEFAVNTASTAEWLADFVSKTVKAESRHFSAIAVERAKEKLPWPLPSRILRNFSGLDHQRLNKTGTDPLDALAGVSLVDDPAETA